MALEEYFEDAHIPPEATQTGSWWIDVGVEFSSPDNACLQWTTSSHPHIVEEVLRISEDHARRVTQLGSSKYSRDLASHLTGVSGCRIEPGPQAQGEFEAAYFQLYTTDKALTYNPEGGHHGKAMTTEAAMGAVQPPPFADGLLKLYQDAAKTNSSNARIEVRVPMQYAVQVLVNVRSAVIRSSLLSFTRSEWW
jgi:hypothetical protein